MSGGGTKTQTTTSNQQSDPWAPAQPLLQQILTAAGDTFNSGVGSQVYTGQRVAGLGDTTQAGLASMVANAGAGSGAANAGNNWLTALLNNGGSTAATQSAVSGLSGINPNVDASGVASAASRLSDPNSLARSTGAALASGAYSTDTNPLTTLAGGLASGGTQTQRSLQDVADGKYLSGGNPYLDKIIEQGAGDAASQVAQQFAASGRYGSGRFSGAVADAVDRVGTQARYQDYSTERDRQAQAASAIDSAGLARAGAAGSLYGQLAGINQGNAGLATTGANLSLSADQAGLSGANTLANLLGSNTDRAISQQGALLSAAQGDRAASMAGLGAVGTNSSNLLQPGQTLAGVGAIQDAARQDQLSSAQSVFDEYQQAPWKQLGLASGLATPIAGLGGTSSGTQVQKVPQASLLQQLFGGGLAAAGVASKFFAPGT